MHTYRDILKVVVIGEKKSGKSTLIESLSRDLSIPLDAKQTPTSNIDMRILVFDFNFNDSNFNIPIKYKIQVQEYTPPEKLHSVKPIEFLLDNAHALIITYNSTRRENFNVVKRMIEQNIDDNTKKKSNFAIIGTHQDMKVGKSEESDFNGVKTFCMTNNVNIQAELDCFNKNNSHILEQIIELNEKKKEGSETKKNKNKKNYQCQRV